MPEWYISNRQVTEEWTAIGFFRIWAIASHHTWPCVALTIDNLWNRNRWKFCPDVVLGVCYGVLYAVVNCILTAGFGITIYHAMSYENWKTFLWQGLFCTCSGITLMCFYFGKNKLFMKKLQKEELLLESDGVLPEDPPKETELEQGKQTKNVL